MRFLLDLLTRNWTLKLTALLLATLLWLTVKAGEENRVRVDNVPIEVTLRDADWVLTAVSPPTADVVFVGPLRELLRVSGEEPRVIVPVDEVRDSVEVQQLRTGWVRLDADLPQTRVEDVRPGAVLMTFERVTIRLRPVAVRTRGELPPGLERVAPIRVEPQAVRVSGRFSVLERLDSIPTAPIELGGIRGPVQLSVALDTTGLGGVIVSPSTVDVGIQVASPPPDTAAVDTAVAGARPPGPPGSE